MYTSITPGGNELGLALLLLARNGKLQDFAELFIRSRTAGSDPLHLPDIYWILSILFDKGLIAKLSKTASDQLVVADDEGMEVSDVSRQIFLGTCVYYLGESLKDLVISSHVDLLSCMRQSYEAALGRFAEGSNPIYMKVDEYKKLE